ncbi:MAG: hypothetical protein NTY03_09880 [Candidatus Bathyarchaeota archaeon]|nr:hypothetical protein [Candidatus Bathyarchaeota archaeon]
MSKTNPYDVMIQNVVASATLDQKINLLDIMKVFRNVEYRPKQFPGLVFRLKRPKTGPSSSVAVRWSARGRSRRSRRGARWGRWSGS